MALKPDRNIIQESIEYFMFTITNGGERGGVVVSATGADGHYGRGPSMDDPNHRIEYAANASGRVPVGMLMWDAVNIDQSRQFINPYRSEFQIGGKAPLMTKGWAVTNKIFADEASGIAIPASAYVGLNGDLYSTAAYSTSSGYPLVGKFLSEIDTEGYAVVQIEL